VAPVVAVWLVAVVLGARDRPAMVQLSSTVLATAPRAVAVQIAVRMKATTRGVRAQGATAPVAPGQPVIALVAVWLRVTALGT